MQDLQIRKGIFLRETKKHVKERKAIERRIRDLSTGNLKDISNALETKEVFNLSDIIFGNVVGRSLCHVWYDMMQMVKTWLFIVGNLRN